MGEGSRFSEMEASPNRCKPYSYSLLSSIPKPSLFTLQDDPRLHFVLIGGSVSKKWIADQGVNFVPLITLENLETQLTQATQAMIEEEVDFGYAKKEVNCVFFLNIYFFF